MNDAAGPKTVCFGPFRLDLTAGELCTDGQRIRLQEQPFQLLKMLVERPGEVVTRDEIRRHLWPNGTVVEFDQSINAAIKKLRLALTDSAEEPRYVETVARRGYRFIASAERPEAARVSPELKAFASDTLEGQTGKAVSRPSSSARLRPWLLAVLIVSVAIAPLAYRCIQRTSGQKTLTLAVLPFQNLSGDPQQEYFSDGMTEALITELGQIRELRVISRISSMHYKGTTKALPEIARELGRMRWSKARLYVPAAKCGSPLNSWKRRRTGISGRKVTSATSAKC